MATLLSEYRMLHYWVEKQLGKPAQCSACQTTRAKRYHWANISQQYLRETNDWMRLCVSCHRIYDYGNLCKKKLHKLEGDNIYVTPSTGKRECFSCKKEGWKSKKKVSPRKGAT